MIFNKHFAAAIAFAYFATGSSQTITVAISQQANGVRFAVSGKLTELPVSGNSSDGVTPNSIQANKIHLYGGSTGKYLILFSSSDYKYYYNVASSTSDLSCNTFPAGVDVDDRFKFSPSLTVNSAFGMFASSTDNIYLYAPNSYIAGTMVSATELIGGQTLANVGFVLSSTCFLQYQVGIGGALQRLEFVVDSTNNAFTAFHVTFYSNTNSPSFSDFEQSCLDKGQALCRYDTLCPLVGGTPTFFGDPDCDGSITGDQSTYIVTDSGEGCSDFSTGAAVRWSTNDADTAPVCNKAAKKTCTTYTAIPPTTVLACCQLTTNAVNTWSKVDGSGTKVVTAACGGGECSRVA